MNKEVLAPERSRVPDCIQSKSDFHNGTTYGKDHDEVKFMIDAFNREVQDLDDVELGFTNLLGETRIWQRVMERTQYANSIEIYMERCRGDVGRGDEGPEPARPGAIEPFKHDLKTKIRSASGSHRVLPGGPSGGGGGGDP